MKHCTISITTTVDGQQTTVKRQGEMALTASSAQLSYAEENAAVALSLFASHGEVVRTGDYSLRLPLKAGESTKGEIGIGGAQGEVEVYTDKLAFSTSENSLLACLHYHLIFGQEKQSMQLRIHATANKGENDEK